jgi:hypothetical protein
MKVVTAVVNNLDFIRIQHYTLKKFFKGDYEFIVFNDAKEYPDSSNGNDTTIRRQIEDLCRELGITCINIPSKPRGLTNYMYQCADAMNFILEYQKANPDKYLLIDSDMFLIDNFDPAKYAEYDCAIVLQSRPNNISYFWNGIYYFDMTKMKNIELLNWTPCQTCDVGGMMQAWLKKQMEGKQMPSTDNIRWTNNTYHTDTIYFIKHLWSTTWNTSELPSNITNKNLIEFFTNDPRNTNGKFFCEVYDNVFLHYRAGGNWRGEGMEFHKQFTHLLMKILTDQF